MVRIVSDEKQLNDLNQKAKLIFSLLGIAIAKEPEKVEALLKNYTISLSKKPSPKELTDKVIFAIGQGNKDFNYELAELLDKQVIPEKIIKEQPLLQNNELKESNFAGAIAGVVGSIAGIFGGKQKQDTAKAQARSQTMNTFLAYKVQQEQAQAAERIDEKKQATIIKTVKYTAILIGVVVIIKLIRDYQKVQT